MRDLTLRSLAALLLTALLVAAPGCASGPVEVELSQLAADQEAYDGDTVVTEGTVREIRDHPDAEPYHVLEDAHDNRVRLLPDELAAEYAGRRVQVRGGFEFDPGQGRLLRAEDVTVLP